MRDQHEDHPKRRVYPFREVRQSGPGTSWNTHAPLKSLPYATMMHTKNAATAKTCGIAWAH